MKKVTSQQVSCLVSSAALNLPAVLASLTFLGCSAHQAPVSEQGQRLERAAPMILSSNNNSDSQLIETSRPSRVLSSQTRSEITNGVTEAVSDAMVSEATSQASFEVVRQPIAPRREERERLSEKTSAVSRNTFNTLTTPVSHLVSAGDTLFSIAFQYDLDFRSLALANGLNPPYTIFVGQQLRLKAASALTEAATEAFGIGINSSINAVSDGSESSSSLRLADVEPMPRQLHWSWPHKGKVITPFQPRLTKGVDISGTVGDSVLAAATGDVVYSGRGVQGTGNLIIIRHSDDYLSAYAHNSVMLVPEGRRVIAGEKIAELGENADGVPMLHFEIRQEGEPVDPSLVLPIRLAP